MGVEDEGLTFYVSHICFLPQHRKYLRIRRLGLITTMDMKAALTLKESLGEVVNIGQKDVTVNVIVMKMGSHIVSVLILSVSLSMGIVKYIKWMKIIKSII